jgi:hypothetical protein
MKSEQTEQVVIPGGQTHREKLLHCEQGKSRSSTSTPVKDKESSLPFVLHFPSWQREIEVALNEPDPRKLLERVHAAETAIFNRLQELAKNAEDASQQAERQAIVDACKTLLILKRDKLGFPDWKLK